MLTFVLIYVDVTILCDWSVNHSVVYVQPQGGAAGLRLRLYNELL
jgi:hypothetical protein